MQLLSNAKTARAKHVLWLAPLVLAALAGQPRASAAPAPAPRIAVIVNKTNPVNNLSMQQLASLYLGRATAFDNGTRVALCEQRSARPRFYKSVLRLSESAVSRHWIGVVFSERNAKPPKDFEYADSAQHFAATTRGAICVMELPAVTDPGVKVLTVEGMAPNHPSYPIR